MPVEGMTDEEVKAWSQRLFDRYSTSTVRCPHCEHSMDVQGCELFNLYEEGEHEVFCTMCDGEFMVTTEVAFTFVSPNSGETGFDD